MSGRREEAATGGGTEKAAGNGTLPATAPKAGMPQPVPPRAGGGLWRAIRETGPAIRRLGEPFVALVEALGRTLGVSASSGGRTTREPTERVGFTIAAIALAAKMAAVDKRRYERQVAAFHEVFQVPEAEKENVRRLFDLASGTTAGYEAYAGRIADLLQGRDAVKEKLLDALFHIAWGDDRIVQPEMDFLQRVASIFGFKDSAFARIAAAHGVGQPSPYSLLGVGRDASWPEVQAAYRRLMKEHHPDRLMAQGMPQELVRLAQERVAAFAGAYESIRAAQQQEGRQQEGRQDGARGRRAGGDQ